MLVAMDLAPLLLSMKLAAVTTLVLLVVGTPLAWWLAHSKSGARRVVDTLVAMPLVLPPTVLGFYLLFLLGPNGPVGWLWEALGGPRLIFSFPGLVVGSTVFSLPFVVQPLKNAFASIGRRPLEVAASLGARPADRFFTVAVPMARPGFITAATLGFAHTVGEFGVVLMIGGNVPGETNVVSIAIYDHVERLEYGHAHVLAGVLVLFAFVVLLALHWLGGAARGDPVVTSLRARLRLERAGFALDVDLELAASGVTSVFGASGSGKTTLLRCIAGHERAPGGFVSLAGEVWQDEARGVFVAPWRRSVGCVFQEPGLFPHLSVRGNLMYGYRRTGRDARRIAPEEVFAWLGLEALLARRPHELSGGERQRVALGMALLTSPRLLLLDEPLSALDEGSRRQILPYLEALPRHLDIPMVYVSHSMAEVARLCDWTVWLDGGRVRRQGSTVELSSSIDLAMTGGEALGAVLDAVVVRHHDAEHLTELEVPGGAFFLRRLERSPGDSVRVRVPARDVSLALDPERRSSLLNVLRCSVVEIPRQRAGSGCGAVARRQRRAVRGAAGADHQSLA